MYSSITKHHCNTDIGRTDGDASSHARNFGGLAASSGSGRKGPSPNRPLLDEDGQPEDGIFQANVSVTVTSDDGSICDYVIPSMLATGTGAYRLAVEPYEGKPYLLGVAFNKQDILHDFKSFLRSPYNQYEYEICVRVKGVTDTTPVSLTFYRSSDTDKATPLIGSPVKKDAGLDDTGSYAEAIFSGEYLLLAIRAALSSRGAPSRVAPSMERASEGKRTPARPSTLASKGVP